MARFEDEFGDPPPQPFPPPEDLSEDFWRGVQPIGSGPQARAFSATMNEQWGAFPPEIVANMRAGDIPTNVAPPPMVDSIAPPMELGSSGPPIAPPPRLEDMPAGEYGSNVMDPDNPYMPSFVPQPPPTPQAWERQPAVNVQGEAPFGVRGRPTATRMGVEQGMGGLGRPEDATFLPSNVLVQQALATLPPIFSMFANRPIGRYDVTSGYGDPTNVGGFYQGTAPPSRAPGGAIEPAPTQGTPTINVGRGTGAPDPQSMIPYGQVATARHEMLHALSFEAQPFAGDAQRGFSLLQEALGRDAVSLQSDPRLTQVAQEVRRFAGANDWSHVFTTLAEASLRGPLPPYLQRYFAPMFVSPPQPGRAPMTAPPSVRP